LRRGEASQEDVIRVGTVAAPAETVNPEMPTGEVELKRWNSYRRRDPAVASKTGSTRPRSPPAVPLPDLRRPEMATVLLRDRIVYAVREYFHKMAFV
jgi:aspartyl-tRNA synthetase